MLSKDIIQKFSQGDANAFEVIYASFYKQIYTYCYRFTISRESAEELTHDIFLHVWNTREYINPEIGIKGYLITISRQIVFTWLRNMSRSKRMKAELQAHFVNNQQKLLPEKQIDATHDLNVLCNVLKALPPKRKLVFEMIRFEEMSYLEVAESLSISRDAVKDHMVKANRVIESIKKSKSYLEYATVIYFFFIPYISLF